MPSVSAEQFEEYVASHSLRLLRTAYLLTGNRAQAEDLVQDSFVATYTKLGRIREVRALDSYVRKTMSNTLVSWSRRPAWKRERPVGDDLMLLNSPASTVDSDEDGRVWGAIRALPIRQRAVIVLRYYGDLSEVEIADALGCSIGTVKSHTHRAMARLATTLAADSAAHSRPETDSDLEVER